MPVGHSPILEHELWAFVRDSDRVSSLPPHFAKAKSNGVIGTGLGLYNLFPSPLSPKRNLTTIPQDYSEAILSRFHHLFRRSEI